MRLAIITLLIAVLSPIAFAGDLGVVGGLFGGPADGVVNKVLDGGDSLIFTVAFTDRSTAVSAFLWCDDFGDTSNDTIAGWWRPLASAYDHVLGIGSPWIPLYWFTDASPWTVDDTLKDFTDSCVYVSWMPDSLIATGSEPFAPPACGGIQFMFKTSLSDCVSVNFKAPTK